MKFFTRSKIALNVLTALSAILAAVLIFNVWGGIDTLNDRPFLLFLMGCAFLVLLIINLLVLKLIIKDAEEDLTAVMKLQSEKKEE